MAPHISKVLFCHNLSTMSPDFIFAALFFEKNWLWVDAHDPEGDGIYSESRTGSRLSYQNWRPQEPNSLTIEKCAYMDTHSTGWNNTPCNNIVPIVCEYDLI